MLTTNMLLSGEVSWIVLIVYLATSMLVKAENLPKSEVEQVPGLIFPKVLGRICMLRLRYVCRWTYEMACGCRLLREGFKRRTLEISLIEKKIKKNQTSEDPEETHGCLRQKDRCIKMS